MSPAPAGPLSSRLARGPSSCPFPRLVRGPRAPAPRRLRGICGLGAAVKPLPFWAAKWCGAVAAAPSGRDPRSSLSWTSSGRSSRRRVHWHLGRERQGRR